MALKRVVLAALFSISVCSASSVIINITGLPAVFENGTYNGFATATIGGIPNQLLLCDDSAHTTNVPSGDIVYDYSSLPTLQYARFTGITGTKLQNYQEAAVLLWELAQVVPSTPHYADIVTEYQYAIWTLFSNSKVLTDPTLLASEQALKATALAYVNGAQTAPFSLSAVYAALVVYTPNPSYPLTKDNQEFLGLKPVPEPAMGWLLGFVGVAVGIGARIRRRRA
jgi:hypothetical protein